MGSYLFEVLIINYVKYQGSQNNFNDFNIRDFFNYLYTNIFYDVDDPKSIQGNINYLTWQERNRISNKAKESFDYSVKAIDFEITQKDQQKAIENWQNIFGEKFPKYE